MELLLFNDVPEEIILCNISPRQVDTIGGVVCISNIKEDTTKLVRFEAVSDLCMQVPVGRDVEILFCQTVNLSLESDKFTFSWELGSGYVNRRDGLQI